MDDVIIVTGVLVLRPPAGRENGKIAGNAIFAVRPSDEGEEEGITCDGVIEFRPPRGRTIEKSPQNGFFEINPSPDGNEMIAGDAISDEDESIPDNECKE